MQMKDMVSGSMTCGWQPTHAAACSAAGVCFQECGRHSRLLFHSSVLSGRVPLVTDLHRPLGNDVHPAAQGPLRRMDDGFDCWFESGSSALRPGGLHSTAHS